MTPVPDQCAREIIEVIPLVMRVIRAEVRGSRFPELSLPEFRSLAFLGRNPGATLGEVACHVGMTPPSASKLIEGLVSAQLVSRETDVADRRRVTLTLTSAGRRRYQAAYDTAVQLLANRLTELPADVKTQIVESMHVLRGVFAQPTPAAERGVARPKDGRRGPAAEKSSGKKQLSHV